MKLLLLIVSTIFQICFSKCPARRCANGSSARPHRPFQPGNSIQKFRYFLDGPVDKKAPEADPRVITSRKTDTGVIYRM